jgi:hypothetical protein
MKFHTSSSCHGWGSEIPQVKVLLSLTAQMKLCRCLRMDSLFKSTLPNPQQKSYYECIGDFGVIL